MATEIRVVAELRRLAHRLLPRTSEIAVWINERLLEVVPELELSTSGQAITLLRQSTEQNFGALIATLAFELTPRGIEPPSGTQALLEEIIAEGGNITDLLRGYRVGHELVWRTWAAHVSAECRDVDVDEVLRLSSQHVFAYMDSVCQRIVDDHYATGSSETTPSEKSGHRNKSELICALLGAEPVDLENATRCLRYELSKEHVALVAVPLNSSASVRVELQRLVDVAGAPALVVPSGDGTWWAWICWNNTPPDRILVSLAGMAVTNVLVGVGEPGYGRQGFRRSHMQAREAVYAGSLASQPKPSVVRHRDSQIAAILCSDNERARRAADLYLGPLAADDETAERLRVTLRTLFRNGNNRRATAAVLNVHIKTITYRITQVEQLLGRSVSSDNFNLQAALLIDRVLREGF